MQFFLFKSCGEAPFAVTGHFCRYSVVWKRLIGWSKLHSSDICFGEMRELRLLLGYAENTSQSSTFAFSC
jgi:hypothetical protein